MELTTSEVFKLGIKWVGVYCLVLGLIDSFKIFPLTFLPEYEMSRLGFEWSGWLSLIGPIGFLTMAIYLLRDGSHIHQYVFPNGTEIVLENTNDFFEVIIKLYGVYLIAGVLPAVFWLLATALIVLRAPLYSSVDDELEAIRSNAISVVSTLGLGTCCLLWSAWLTDVALRRRKLTA